MSTKVEAGMSTPLGGAGGGGVGPLTYPPLGEVSTGIARGYSYPFTPPKTERRAPFKYNEPQLIQELSDYVASTYGQHYAGDDNIQAIDLIISAGHGVGFTVGDIIKYASRLYKKGDDKAARKDILKILHYSLLLLHIHDKGVKPAS